MTTTELIELLRNYEFGGATGRPREVMFEVNEVIYHTDGMRVSGTGDGLFTELFLELPSADVRENVRGKWLEHKDIWGDPYYECSACKELFCLTAGTPQDNCYNFCPNCGADMSGEQR